MKQRSFAARFACACALLFLTIPISPAAAGDNSLLIWAPSKTSDYGYKLRLGARAPQRDTTRAGVDLSIAATSTGRINDPADPVRLWAETSSSGPLGAARRLNVGLNTLTGAGAANIGLSRTWMVTPGLDVAGESGVSISCNAYHAYCGSMNASQALRLSAIRTGTSLTASRSMVGTETTSASVALEQRLSDNLNLRAAMRDLLATPVGSVRATFSFAW
jgi:hypothetical protein